MSPKKRRRGNRLLKVFFVLFACLFIVSGGMAGYTLYQNKQAADAFAALRAQAEAERQATAQAAADAEAARQALAASYETMHSQNSDYAGWLVVGGTQIDYPVMWTPDAPNYYLRRAFDQSDSASGTPFIGEGADIDSDCLLIYGHEMKDGAMFGELDRYADAAFAAQKLPITIYTRTEARTYEVFAALQTRILQPGETGYRYQNAAGPLDQAGFDALVSWLRDNALYDSGVVPSYGQQILLLSTCSYHTENGRFLVAARRIS